VMKHALLRHREHKYLMYMTGLSHFAAYSNL